MKPPARPDDVEAGGVRTPPPMSANCGLAVALKRWSGRGCSCEATGAARCFRGEGCEAPPPLGAFGMAVAIKRRVWARLLL